MRIKSALTAVAILVAAHIGIAQEKWTQDFRNAMRYGAMAKLTLKIVDDDGQPVPNAVSDVSFIDIATRMDETRGLSDTDGLFTASGKARLSIGGTVSKVGYYASNFKFKKGDPPGLHDYGGESSKIYYDSLVKDGRWLPWNPTIPVVLREVRNPIPMYVAHIDKRSMPSGVAMEFDCIKQDWLAPYGDGSVADFRVQFVAVDSPGYDGACRLILSPVDEGGGFLRRQKMLDSQFVSEHDAPLEGYAGFEINRVKELNFKERNPDDITDDDYLIFTAF